jgi:hypothetical protein
VPNHERENGKGPFDGKTYLYIRTHPADDGTEPLPAGLQFWLSPDISVIKRGGSKGDEAVAGQQNTVEVIVTNAGGIDANDAYVEAFWANPSTVMTPATATPIGAGFITIPGYSTAAAQFPWTPSASEAGHRCLFARVSLTIPLDTYLDPNVFDVVGDRHVAQRNISVVAFAAAKTLSFAFVVLNPGAERAGIRVHAAQVREGGELRHLARAVGCELAHFTGAPLGGVGLVAGRQPVSFDGDQDRLAHANLVAKARTTGVVSRASAANARPSVGMTLNAGAARQAILQLTRGDARAGELQAVRITQTGEDGAVQGGLTVVVRS